MTSMFEVNGYADDGRNVLTISADMTWFDWTNNFIDNCKGLNRTEFKFWEIDDVAPDPNQMYVAGYPYISMADMEEDE